MQLMPPDEKIAPARTAGDKNNYLGPRWHASNPPAIAVAYTRCPLYRRAATGRTIGPGGCARVTYGVVELSWK